MKWLRRKKKGGEPPPVVTEPRVFVEEMTFSDDVKIGLGHNSILVVTGPNNTGKSSVLREIRDYLLYGEKFGPVIKSAKLKIVGTIDDFRRLIADRSVRAEYPGVVSIEGNRYRLSDLKEDFAKSFSGSDATRVLFSHLAAGERLALTDPVRKGDYLTTSPKEPLQWLELEDSIEAKVCDDFQRTFRMQLVLNRLAGEKLMLHVFHPSEHENIPTGNTRARAKWLSSLQELHRQGDGMRSYVGTLLALAVHPKHFILLDEPEAFLHPPQTRRLASLLAEGTNDAQLIVATHSDEFVRSILDCAGDRVTIIRIDRHIAKNKITVLGAAEIQRLWIDPLLRTSDVLSALFHEVAVICEGDSDARFFRALLEATEDEPRDKDFRFLHLGGKDRIASIAAALRAIGVPVVAVVDIDVLSDREKFFTLFESMGGRRSEVEADLKLILSSVSSRKGQLTANELAVELERCANDLRGQIEISGQKRNEITQLVRAGSNWQRIKEDGYRALVDAPSIQAFERIAAAANRVGLLINREGELEGFCREISRTRKSDWLAAVLQRNLAEESALAAAREFAAEIRRCMNAMTDKTFD